MDRVFGIKADGKVIQLGFPNAKVAETVAQDLFSQGHALIEIVDYTTGKVVKALSSTVASSIVEI